MEVQGSGLMVGDTFTEMEIAGEVVTSPWVGKTIEDLRPSSISFLMTVGVKLDGEWIGLPTEGRYSVDRDGG